ncbi:MAG: hypothetical protein KBS74_00250 [Clostridiales bacterium]|nr:hypothetical protein [Candidatus Cacconaster stercorequi]
MEKKLNMGSFEAMSANEMMEVDGGYTFLCNKPNPKMTADDYKNIWNIAKKIYGIVSKW